MNGFSLTLTTDVLGALAVSLPVGFVVAWGAYYIQRLRRQQWVIQDAIRQLDQERLNQQAIIAELNQHVQLINGDMTQLILDRLAGETRTPMTREELNACLDTIHGHQLHIEELLRE